MWLIVGLGNPGAKYELTRHNIGFLALDALLDTQGISSLKTGFSGKTARFIIQDQPCVALKPETFMNRSGTSVQQAMAFHKILLEQVVVIHDDLDLALGEIRIKQGGGSGGHNGLKDITRLVGENYVRVRLGIGRPSFKGTEADYVLNPFSDQELVVLGDLFKKINEAIKTIVSEGLESAQRTCQVKP
jgi:peptidyl-tRNA hydrolase, PTH1 family